MALVRCGECGGEVSDRAANCPKCGAPIDASTAIPAPEAASFANGQFSGTRTQLTELAKRAIELCNYRVDTVDPQAGTVGFTTGITMGSWSGVSGTILLEEVGPFRFTATGQGKQNVKGGQMVALNLFDEANAKARNVIEQMQRLAGGAESSTPSQGGCLVLLCGLTGSALAILLAGANLV